MELTCLNCGHAFDLTGFVGGAGPACPKCLTASSDNPWPEKEDTQPNLDPSWPQAAGQGYPALELFSQTSDFQMPEGGKLPIVGGIGSIDWDSKKPVFVIGTKPPFVPQSLHIPREVAPLLLAMSEEEKMHEKIREEWRRKLTPKSPVHGPNGFPQIEIGGWDLHELYTILVDDEGPEGCCAGCTILPPGWCSLCDKTRKAPKEGT
jgi:hypothetical protein